MTTMTNNVSKFAETLVDSLPTRDDLINAIGLASRRSTSADFATVLGVFGAGLLIGAGLALLFAPKAGEELRRDLGERFSSADEPETRVTGAASFHSSPASAGL